MCDGHRRNALRSHRNRRIGSAIAINEVQRLTPVDCHHRLTWHHSDFQTIRPVTHNISTSQLRQTSYITLEPHCINLDQRLSFTGVHDATDLFLNIRISTNNLYRGHSQPRTPQHHP